MSNLSVIYEKSCRKVAGHSMKKIYNVQKWKPKICVNDSDNCGF